MNAPETIQAAALLPYSAISSYAIGDPIDSGKFAGLITLPDGRHCAVVLLPNKSDGDLRWAKAMEWAAQAGGQLPSRPVAALLFANLRGEFEKTWHWTDETHEADASCAWFCLFSYGNQFYFTKCSAGAARAVRLIHLVD